MCTQQHLGDEAHVGICDGDSFAESLAEAKRLAVLDMPNRLKSDEAAGKNVQASVARTIAFVRKGDMAAARANRLSATVPAYDEFLDANHAVEVQAEEFSEAASTGAATIAAGGKRMIIAVTILALLLASACAVLITRGITRGVVEILDRLGSLKDRDTTDLAHGLTTIAGGDLTHPVSSTTTAIEKPGHDEIGQIADAVNAIRENTRASIEGYNQMREQLAGVMQAAGNASEAIRLLADSSQEVGSAIGELSQRSDRIVGIVDTITGIAEQTNLLALNAAIEAARAGEQGRGFAVVAEEVRKLAEESQTAAGQIAGLVDEIQAYTRAVVGAVADGAARTDEGVTTVQRTREAFEAIGEAVSDVSARVAEIATAVEHISNEAGRAGHDVGEVAGVAEQSSASAQQVSAATEQTSASTQEIATSANDLAETAEHLDALVARFKVAA